MPRLFELLPDDSGASMWFSLRGLSLRLCVIEVTLGRFDGVDGQPDPLFCYGFDPRTLQYTALRRVWSVIELGGQGVRLSITMEPVQ
jgi:hypothetical protein